MTSDGCSSLEDRMLRAIGYVVTESSFLSQELQSFAELLAGTPLVADLLADATLGSQVRQVRRLLTVVELRQNIDPLLAEQMSQVLKTLDSGPLVKRRNDVAHGLWGADFGPGGREVDDPEDLIMCDRLNLTGWASITTTVRSLHLIGDALALAAAALSHAGSAHAIRSPDPRWSNLGPEFFAAASKIWNPGAVVPELLSAIRAMEDNAAEGWLWRTEIRKHKRQSQAPLGAPPHDKPVA